MKKRDAALCIEIIKPETHWNYNGDEYETSDSKLTSIGNHYTKR